MTHANDTDPATPSITPGGQPGGPSGGPVDPRLLEILVCPVSKGTLRYDRERGELVSEQAGLAYPIRDGIPIMLPDEARRLDG
ncbi:Trm112 family protein [Roseomonas sp. USHLN139]|uniref:Trm112 family protein n=1 Tax=Roseomonas sp. USHLN139 TaxID=3081298 RepID=UPI003FA7B714